MRLRCARRYYSIIMAKTFSAVTIIEIMGLYSKFQEEKENFPFLLFNLKTVIVWLTLERFKKIKKEGSKAT